MQVHEICTHGHAEWYQVSVHKDVLYIALVMMNMTRGDALSLPLPNR